MAKTIKDSEELKDSEVADRKGMPLEMMASQMADKMAKSGEQPDKVVGIKKGDTLSALAKKYGTTVKALMEDNPDIKDANKIKAGAKLNLKQKSTPPKSDEDKFAESQDPYADGGYKAGGSLRRASGGGLGVGKALRGYGAVRKN
jgi:hypothetical protein